MKRTDHWSWSEHKLSSGARWPFVCPQTLTLRWSALNLTTNHQRRTSIRPALKNKKQWIEKHPQIIWRQIKPVALIDKINHVPSFKLNTIISLFVYWFQPGLISQPTIFSSHNKPAPAGLISPETNQRADRISGEHDTVQIRSGSFARRSRLQRVTWSAGAVNLDNSSWFLSDYAPLLPGWYWSAAHDIWCFQQIISLSLVLVSAPKLCSPSQWRRTALAAHPDVQIIGFSWS